LAGGVGRRFGRAPASAPILIERPVIVRDDGRAVLGRPPEKVRELL
jgi:arsenate reductase-like glutaredoxin family protein